MIELMANEKMTVVVDICKWDSIDTGASIQKFEEKVAAFDEANGGQVVDVR